MYLPSVNEEVTLLVENNRVGILHRKRPQSEKRSFPSDSSTFGNPLNFPQVNVVETDKLQQQLESTWKADFSNINLRDGARKTI